MKNKRDSFNPNAGPGSYKRDKEVRECSALLRKLELALAPTQS